VDDEKADMLREYMGSLSFMLPEFTRGEVEDLKKGVITGSVNDTINMVKKAPHMCSLWKS